MFFVHFFEGSQLVHLITGRVTIVTVLPPMYTSQTAAGQKF